MMVLQLLSNTASELEFNVESEECAFKEYLEPELLTYGQVGLYLTVCCNLVWMLPLYVQHAVSEDDDDGGASKAVPRKICYIIWGSDVLLSLSIAFLAYVRQRSGCFSTWDWERIVWFAFVCNVVVNAGFNAWHGPALLGAKPEEVWPASPLVNDQSVALMLDALASGAAMFVPLRAQVMWSVPVLGLALHILTLIILGSSASPLMNTVNIAQLFVATIFALFGARRHEVRLRRCWRRSQELNKVQERFDKMHAEFQKCSTTGQGFEILAKACFTVAIFLQSDLKVSDHQNALEPFFGRPVHETLLADSLREDDQTRFRLLIESATRSPRVAQQARLSLHLSHGHFGVDMVAVAIRDEKIEFVIGVSVLADEDAAVEFQEQSVSTQEAVESSGDVPSDGQVERLQEPSIPVLNNLSEEFSWDVTTVPPSEAPEVSCHPQDTSNHVEAWTQTSHSISFNIDSIAAETSGVLFSIEDLSGLGAVTQAHTTWTCSHCAGVTMQSRPVTQSSFSSDVGKCLHL